LHHTSVHSHLVQDEHRHSKLGPKGVNPDAQNFFRPAKAGG
jgi:hypothetical protein